MTQYARPNADADNPEHNPFGGVDGWLREDTSTWQNIYVSIDESSTNDSDYIKQENSGATTSTYKAALGNTVTDPVTALSNHKVKYRAVANDSSMAGVPTLTVALYEGSTEIITATNSSIPDEGMMGGGTWADFTISLNSTQAGNIGTYNDLVLWFRMSASNGMGDYIKVSQAWFECADVPEEDDEATTSPAFLLFME